ncbi:MAG: PAS domain S-box protein, partial [Syntrophales bacterium]|nr:PAS domain S-box protein [Syntrophales bacterium]
MSVHSFTKRKEIITWTKTHLDPALIDMSHARGSGATDVLISSILDAVPHAVLGIQERSVFFANGAVEAVFGWKPNELIGHSSRVLYHSDDEFEEMQKLLYSVLETHNTHQTVFLFRHREGRTVICRVHVSRIGADLTNKMFVSTFEDITEQHEKELKLKQLNENLDVMVRQRTAEVSAANDSLQEQIRIRGRSE